MGLKGYLLSANCIWFMPYLFCGRIRVGDPVPAAIARDADREEGSFEIARQQSLNYAGIDFIKIFSECSPLNEVLPHDPSEIGVQSWEEN